MQRLYVFFVVSVFLVLGAIFPRYTEQDDNALLNNYKKLQNEIESNGTHIPFPVMTFNMRMDVHEKNPENHYTKRIYRIKELFNRWNPYIIGVQEPFGGQILHLQSIIPKYYKAVGYNRNSFDAGHPSRVNDFNVAILYDDRVMKLMENDFLWLSKTPKIDQSKDWGSGAVRALNIARFRMVHNGIEGKQDFVVFNTHLDRWGELARREQSKLVKKTMEEWEAKYPKAIFFLTGDFNACPGQAAYVTLTSLLTDSWVWCKDHSDTCTSNSIVSSFHDYKGTVTSTYLARFLETFVFLFHGMGVAPPQEGTGKNSWTDVFYDFILHRFPLSEALPHFPFNRLHVDWILFRQGGGKEEDRKVNESFEPKFVAVADARSANFSSDHFPIISLFSLDKNLLDD